MDKKATKELIIDNSNKIAELVSEINTDYRGNLFLAISNILEHKSQGYTAKLFEKMAEEYGISPNADFAQGGLIGKLTEKTSLKQIFEK